MKLNLGVIIIGVVLLTASSTSQVEATKFRHRPVVRSVANPTINDVKLPILLYHHIAAHQPQNPYFVSPENLEAHFKWLKDNGYEPITMGHAADCLQSKCQLPSKAVVITFDDGWTDEYLNGFPILKKYSFPATFYIKLNNYNGLGGLTTNQLKEMAAAGIEIASHTMTHPNLKTKPAQQLNFELRESKRILEHDLGVPVHSFAYPGGAFNDRVVAAVKAAGYQSATTTIHSIQQNSADLFRLRRIHIDDDMDNLIERVEGRMP